MPGRTNSRDTWDEKFYNDRGITFGENSSFGDGSSIFDRMRERISRGENWNVREVWNPENTTIIHLQEVMSLLVRQARKFRR